MLFRSRAEGHRAEFIGSEADTKMTGKKFAALVGNAPVLFPQAKGSLRSIQQQFVGKQQAIDLPVYETLQRTSEVIPSSDIMVFTSPSNVEAFFGCSGLESRQQVVAMGDATASALRQYRIMHPVLADTFDDTGLARAVFLASSR